MRRNIFVILSNYALFKINFFNKCILFKKPLFYRVSQRIATVSYNTFWSIQLGVLKLPILHYIVDVSNPTSEAFMSKASELKERNLRITQAIEKIADSLIHYVIGSKNTAKHSDIDIKNHGSSKTVRITVTYGYEYPMIIIYLTPTHISYAVKHYAAVSYGYNEELRSYFNRNNDADVDAILNDLEDFIYTTSTLFKNLIRLSSVCPMCCEWVKWNDKNFPNHLSHLLNDTPFLDCPYTILDHTFTCTNKNDITNTITVLSDSRYRRACGY